MAETSSWSAVWVEGCTFSTIGDRRAMDEFISFHEARQVVLGNVSRLGSERVPLSEALHRTLAEDVTSRDDVPPFDNSAMDGFALRAVDVDEPGRILPCVGEMAAGDDGSAELEPGACMAIMTGAPLPHGADTVVPIEQATRQTGNGVRFDVQPDRGDHIRRAGEDLRVGDRVIEAGRIVTPGAIAIMASLGVVDVPVTSNPSVGIVTTGTELVEVHVQPAPGQIRDSNGPTLAALTRTAGGTVLGAWRARDERAEIRRALERALEAEVVVVSGGVSVGEYDLVKDELDSMGMELLFWKVRQRPGKPLAFGLIDDKPIFGLPGNPVSSAVCFEEYVRPALAKLLGRSTVTRPLARGVLTSPLPKVEGLHYFARGRSRWEDARLLLEPAPHQGSHVASSLLYADGFIHLPAELAEAPAGLEVDFEFFGM